LGKGALTRGRILDEAVRIASREGVEGLSIGTLAAALDLSKSGLFAHFGSKEALQIAVLEHTSTRFRESVRPRLENLAGLAKLRTLFESWLDWLSSPDLPGGCPILGAAFEMDGKEGPVRDALVRLQATSAESVHRVIQEAVDRGELSPLTDVAQAGFEFRGLTLAYHHASRVMGDPTARRRALKAFEDRIVSWRQGP